MSRERTIQPLSSILAMQSEMATNIQGTSYLLNRTSKNRKLKVWLDKDQARLNRKEKAFCFYIIAMIMPPRMDLKCLRTSQSAESNCPWFLPLMQKSKLALHRSNVSQQEICVGFEQIQFEGTRSIIYALLMWKSCFTMCKWSQCEFVWDVASVASIK